jgi:hypothetical protein
MPGNFRLDANEAWEVWTDWYEARLEAGPTDQAIEVARATIPGRAWEEGPKVVNAQIRRLLEERGIWRYATAGLGEPSTETSDRGALERRLAVLSIQEVAAIGVRAALRALPLMSFDSVAEPTAAAAFLKILRITSLTWAAAAYPRRTPNLVPLNAARIDAINSRVGLVRAAAAAAAAYSTNRSDKVVEEVARGIHALRTASSQLDADAAAAGFDLALNQDLNDLLGAPEGAAALAQIELWPGGAPPEWMARRWETLKRDLIYPGHGWEVWVDWYEDRLAGRTRSEGHELAYVEVPDELWEEDDPAGVNTWIMRRFDKLADKSADVPTSEIITDVPEIPRPGPGPRFQASPAGPIDRAPTSEVDENGNEVRTIEHLKPLVLRCVSELKARLSRNEFPELLVAVEQYEAALIGQNVQWGEVWGLGVILQNAASSAERRIADRILPAPEDPAKTALDSLLALHGPLILATGEGAELSTAAQTFVMTREEQAELREASEQVAEQLKMDREVASPRAAADVASAVGAIGEGKHPERGTVYALATVKNISIVLIGGAAIATPTLVGALLGSTIGAMVGAPFSFLVGEAVKKSPAFSALATQLGAHLDAMTDADLQGWIEERSRHLAPFRSFVISNEEPLRKIAASTNELKWMLRYIDFVVGKERL